LLARVGAAGFLPDEWVDECRSAAADRANDVTTHGQEWRGRMRHGAAWNQACELQEWRSATLLVTARHGTE
jgi:hypothetical protein